MVETQILARGLRNPRVIRALLRVPRHAFVPAHSGGDPYGDAPVPIGHGQTISQPFIVAYMTDALDVRAGDTVLEIGTGSGYQAAVLAEMGAEVFSMEVVGELAAEARVRLEALGYAAVRVRHGDGYRGWPKQAPFDRILLTAAPPEVPVTLLGQLGAGGVLVAPVGEAWQELVRVRRQWHGALAWERLIPVRFVPMVGAAER